MSDQTKEWSDLVARQRNEEHDMRKGHVVQQSDILKQLMGSMQAQHLRDLEMRQDRYVLLLRGMRWWCWNVWSFVYKSNVYDQFEYLLSHRLIISICYDWKYWLLDTNEIYMYSRNSLKRPPLRVVLNMRWPFMRGKINLIFEDHGSKTRQFVWFWWDFAGCWQGVPLNKSIIMDVEMLIL